MALRRHIITGEPVLLAPDRAGRPNAFGRETGDDRCPFCPGNEADTPPEISRLGDPWRIRVFPNKYPAVEGHEVIVESESHEATFDSLADPGEVIALYAERYRAHADARFVSLFRNHGVRAGASLDHLHSQLMPLPFVPPRPAREIEAFRSESCCPLCRAIPEHARSGLVIAESETFALIAPSGSQHAWEQWVVPLQHVNDVSALSEREAGDLGRLLQRAVGSARQIAPSHNVLFMNFAGVAAGHLYVVILPRSTSVAGFELGSGAFIDVVDPAAAARRFR